MKAGDHVKVGRLGKKVHMVRWIVVPEDPPEGVLFYCSRQCDELLYEWKIVAEPVTCLGCLRRLAKERGDEERRFRD